MHDAMAIDGLYTMRMSICVHDTKELEPLGFTHKNRCSAEREQPRENPTASGLA